MTTYAACRPIYAELRAIAERTYVTARALCADPSNPAFVSTMERPSDWASLMTRCSFDREPESGRLGTDALASVIIL